MSAHRPWVSACLMIFGLAGSASATTYYVATNGNDVVQRLVGRALGDAAARGRDDRARRHDPRALRQLCGLPDTQLGHDSAPKTLTHDSGATVVVNTPAPRTAIRA